MNYKCVVISILFAIQISIASLANAAPIIHTFTADINFVGGSVTPFISVKDKAYITVTFDPTQPVKFDPNAAERAFDPTDPGRASIGSLSRYDVIQLDVKIGSFSESYKPAAFGGDEVAAVIIRNDTQQAGYVYDSYRLEGVKGTSWFDFEIMDFSHSVYSDTSLPAGIPDLSVFRVGPARPRAFGDADLKLKFRNSCCITGEARGTVLSVTSSAPD